MEIRDNKSFTKELSHMFHRGDYMGRMIWKRKRMILIVLLLVAMLSTLLPYRNILDIRHVFASHNYQNILVLDAGHGGIDGGAVAEDGTSEQQINLEIVKKCESLAGLFGIQTILTRKDSNSIGYQADQSIRWNKVADIHAREDIVNNTVNPIFISIHLNKFTDPSYTGAQVFWSKNNVESSLLAQQIQTTLTTGLSPIKERKAKQAVNSIYLMKVLKCPAVIVECGFLSNIEEAKKLAQDEYQKQVTLCIIGGYLQYAEQS